MDEPVRIPIAALESLCSALLEKVRAEDGDSFLIERDYFWSIPADERRNMLEQPRELTVGQLCDSWSSLGPMIDDPDRRIAFGLVWLADILRAIGEDVVR